MAKDDEADLPVDISSVDPELRGELRALLQKFSDNMSPKFATMLSAEMQSALFLTKQSAGEVKLNVRPLDEATRKELRQRFDTFVENYNPDLAKMLINSVQATLDQLRAAGEAN